MAKVLLRSLLPLLVLALLPTSVEAARLVAQPGESLQALIDQAQAGDQIIVSAGHYSERLIVHTAIHLSGEPGAVIDAGGEDDAIRVQAPDVTLEGLSIRNWGRNLTAINAGVFVEQQAVDVRILNNDLHGPGFGIRVDAAAGAKIIGNRIQGDERLLSQDRGNGIHLYHVQHAEILDNQVWHARDGIYIEVSNHNVLRGNHLHDLRYGIHYMYSMDNRVENNHTTRTRTGYALMQSKRLTVTGNVSKADENYGILLNNITDSLLHDNRVDGARTGHNPRGGTAIAGAEGKAVFVYNAQRNRIIGNTFSNSDIGIHLTAGSEDNALFDNAFISNQTQVMYVATREQEWSHEGRGNYWSDYLGWDLDGDGVGDTPYEPNDGMDRLLWRYPVARLLMDSPAVLALRWVQRQFPVFRPAGVKDSHPLMSTPELHHVDMGDANA